VTQTDGYTGYFIDNPDIILRKEHEDGPAILFNPDTNQIRQINATGLFIWKQWVIARTMDEIVDLVQKEFEGVPLDRVTRDVQKFVDGMLASGFISSIPDSFKGENHG
jgi:hypothetical protein